ncbi:MAG: YdhR family protein [candidate division Zixibacteria bacterium]
MSGKILQLNFTFNVSAGEYEKAVSPLAEKFAAVPGLRWKIWLMNEDKSEAGGIYLFDSASSLENFLSGELAAAVSSHPALSDMSVKQFDIMEGITSTTRGPV